MMIRGDGLCKVSVLVQNSAKVTSGSQPLQNVLRVIFVLRACSFSTYPTVMKR